MTGSDRKSVRIAAARFVRASASVVALITVLSAAPSRTVTPSRTTASSLAFVDVNVVPMDSERVLEHQTVVIQDERIVGLGPASSVAVPPTAIRVDGSGKWLMPGLVDMHVHLNDPDDGALYVANGVTTIRNMSGFPRVLDWRKEYAEGQRLGPSVYSCGPILDGKPPVWPGSAVIETAADADRELEAEKAAGYDFVKVYSRLSRMAYLAILDAARRKGMRVVGHVPERVGLIAALDARGQESIEHLTGYLAAAQEPGPPAPRLADWNARRRMMIAHLDDTRIPELARRTREAGVWNCVTLVVSERMSALENLDSLTRLPAVRYASAEQLTYWNPARDFRLRNSTAEDFAAMRAATAFQMRMTRALNDSGARILLGTDTSNPFVVAGFAVHDELALLVEAGLTPYEALRAGTADAAEFLHASMEFGRVARGLRADLILVDANPLADVRAASHRSGVMLRGRWMPVSELNQALQTVEWSRNSGRR